MYYYYDPVLGRFSDGSPPEYAQDMYTVYPELTRDMYGNFAGRSNNSALGVNSKTATGYKPSGTSVKGPSSQGFLGRNIPSGVPMYDAYFARPLASNTQFLKDAYQQLIGHPITQQEIQPLMGELEKGLTGYGAVNMGATAPEVQRMQDYQRAYTTAYRPGYQEFSPSGQYQQPIYMPSYGNYAAPKAPYSPSYSSYAPSQDLIAHIENVVANGLGPQQAAPSGGKGGKGGGGEGHSSGGITELRTRWS